MEAHEAMVQVTYNGRHGELAQPVHFDSTDGDIRAWVSEALRTGGVQNIPADPEADLRDFSIERYPVKDGRPSNLLMVRPKVPFGR